MTALPKKTEVLSAFDRGSVSMLVSCSKQGQLESMNRQKRMTACHCLLYPTYQPPEICVRSFYIVIVRAPGVPQHHDSPSSILPSSTQSAPSSSSLKSNIYTGPHPHCPSLPSPSVTYSHSTINTKLAVQLRCLSPPCLENYSYKSYFPLTTTHSSDLAPLIGTSEIRSWR